MTETILKHITGILVRLVQIFCEVNDCTHIALEDVQQAAEGLDRLGFDLSDDMSNAIIQRALGILALQDVVVELM